MRPIVSARDTIFSGMTKELGRILGPLVGHTQHHLRDSADLVSKLEGIVIPPDYELVSLHSGQPSSNWFFSFGHESMQFHHTNSENPLNTLFEAPVGQERSFFENESIKLRGACDGSQIRELV